MTRPPVPGLCLGWCLIVLLSLSPRAAWADMPSALMRRCQRATATVYNEYEVEAEDGIYVKTNVGTAFCITQSGYFVTDAHVLGNATEVRVAVDRWPDGVYYYDAHLVKESKDLDLALLKVDHVKDLTPLSIATPATATVGQHVTVLGYPVKESYLSDQTGPLFKKALAHGGRITRLYGRGHTLTDVQTDTGMGPGGSGGPVLNDRGQLVGILQKGRRGSRANLSKSVGSILKFLSTPEVAAALRKPELEFSLPDEIPGVESMRERKFDVRILNGLNSLQGARASLTLRANGVEPRTYRAAVRSDGVFDFHAPPLPPVDLHTLTLTTGSDSSHLSSCQAKDRSLSCGSKTIRLSDIARIDHGAQTVVTLLSGELVYGDVQGLEAVPTIVAGQVAPRDLRAEKRIIVREGYRLPRAVEYRVAITRANKTLGEREGRIRLSSPPRRMGQPMLLACGSAWATNDTGSATGKAADLRPSTAQYIRNIADLFTGGARSRILIESDHWTFGAPFQEVLRAAGHTVTVSLDPGPLDQYDAIFVGGKRVDQHPLIDYVKQGGKVYLSGGTDAGGDGWNDLLTAFGLWSMNDVVMEKLPGSGSAYAPLFEGVKELRLDRSMRIKRTDQAQRDTAILVNQSETNLWALYKSGEKLAPEPPPVVAVQRPPTPTDPRGADPRRLIPGRLPPGMSRMPMVMLRIGDPTLDLRYKLLEEKSTTSQNAFPRWRSAEDGGWFSFELKPKPNMKHVITLFSLPEETDKRGFDLMVDGVKLTEMPKNDNVPPPNFTGLPPGFPARPTRDPINGAKGERSVAYLVPKELVKDKDHIVVRLQSRPGKSTGRITTILMSTLQELGP